MGLYKNNYNGIQQNICKSSKKILKISGLSQLSCDLDLPFEEKQGSIKTSWYPSRLIVIM